MKQEDIKISVITPVYQVEKYLKQCIDSVLEQSYTNIEVILVDDGATDNSPFICDEYVRKYENIKVIHQENAGLSVARNTGIINSSGSYILFLDSDDFWDDAYAIERLVLRLKKTNPDVLNFSYKKYYEDRKEEKPYFENIIDMPIYKSKTDQLEFLTTNNLYIASACNKLIRKDLLNAKLMFKKGVYSEDIEWCAKLLMYSRTMDFVCENFYCYRQRKDSIRYSISDKNCRDLADTIINCFKVANRAEDNMKLYLYRYIAYQYGTFFIVQAQAENEQKDCIEELVKYKKILKYHCKNKKIIILNILCKITGYKKACKIIRFLYNVKNQRYK